MKYGNVTLGQVEAVWNKLGGEEGVQRFLSGETIVSAAQKVWKAWRTLKLGTGIKDGQGFLAAISEAKQNASDWSKDIIAKPAFTVSPEAKEVELVVVSVAELGFKDGATRADIYKRANELGLDLCPAEVGPQLRLQYTDQPKGEWLLIGMEPITDSDGDLDVFDVGRSGDGGQWLGLDDGEQWLSTINGDADFVWDADDRWVFLLRK